MTDARERRRQRAAERKDSPDVKATLRKFMVPIIIVIIAGGIIAAIVSAQDDAGCPGHWHAGYSVWDGDEQMRFSPAGPAGSPNEPPPVGFHIHNDDGILHFHPAVERCIATGGAMEKLGVTVSADRLVLPNGDERVENGTDRVVVYHQAWDEEWREVSNVGSFMGEQLGNGDRMMIAYVTDDDAVSIDDRLNATTSLAGGSYEPRAVESDPKTFMEITATVIFAILAIVLWYNFAKKTW